MVDYYNNYIEVKSLFTSTSASVIRSMQIIFARWGIPTRVVSDNGPQFDSAEFTNFSKSWDFIHVTLSPYFHRSNSLAECAVGIVEELFIKYKEARISEAEAMLDHSNTPNASGLSPAQMMIGLHCRTHLYTRRDLLLMSNNHQSAAHEKHLLSKEKVANIIINPQCGIAVISNRVNILSCAHLDSKYGNPA